MVNTERGIGDDCMTSQSSGPNFETSPTSKQDTPQDDDLLTFHPDKEPSPIRGLAHSQKE